MRLTRVHVTKLFGLFDHEIRLNQDERLTIIHGPNGFGKTVILRMIAALVSGRYTLFLTVPFETFIVESDSGLHLAVRRHQPLAQEEAKQDEGDISVSVYQGEREEPGQRSWSLIEARRRSLLIERATMRALSQEYGADAVKKALGTQEEFLSEPDWLAKGRSHFPKVRLIRTQRLGLIELEDQSPVKPTVEAYSEDISTRIQQTLAEYAARSQELDRTFPTRLLSRAAVAPMSAEVLRKKLSALEQKRSELTHLGFLGPEPLGLRETSVEAIEAKKDVLTVYVEDMESKLAIFDEMASKIQLFVRIINERFMLKTLTVHREQGFVFTSATGAHLKPSHLSSGEQHELILFYELLFQMKKDELILIDEPEISLHVAWQEKFLEDLSEVVKLVEVDAVIATHSPEIIGEHWDLTVELKSPAATR